MNKSRKGRRKEHRVRQRLEKRGYLVVRSTSPKGPFGLVAVPLPVRQVKAPETRLIQVSHAKATKPQRKNFLELRKRLPIYCTLEFWVAEDYKKPYCQYRL